MLVSITAGFYLANQTNPNSQNSPTPQISPTATPIIEPIQSLSNFYLQYMGAETKVFVVSANASYGDYPGPTVTWAPFEKPNGAIIAKNGEPCVIINVTMRIDYSTQYPVPNPMPPNSTLVFIALHAELFNGENEVSAVDITNASPWASVSLNKAFTSLDYGENTTLTIYLATSNTDITSFQLTGYYVGGILPP